MEKALLGGGIENARCVLFMTPLGVPNHSP
jgi:hypothetical protein